MTQLPETMPTDWQRALAVVAHPDDLEYGAAAAISRWTDQGKEIAYLLVSKGEAGIDTMDPAEAAHVRVEEQRASAAVVGVRTVEFLDYQDGVIEEGVPLRRDIAESIRRHRPELVVTLAHSETLGAGFWNTADHRATGRATLDAVADAGNRWIHTEQLTRDGLRPWNGVRWVAVAAHPRPTHFQKITDRDVERAVESLAAHHAYLSALSDQEPIEYARSFMSEVLGTAPQGDRQGLGFRLYSR